MKENQGVAVIVNPAAGRRQRDRSRQTLLAASQAPL